MNRFSIKDIETITGIKAHTLRIWEQRYSFLETKRSESNIRYYDEEDLKLLLNISILNENGFKISEIAKMCKEDLTDAVHALSKEACNYGCHVQTLCQCTIELNEKGFKKILNLSIKKIGLEQTVLQVIYPFFQKIGLMWQTGTLNPAQEHFASNLIKQKLIVSIDGLRAPCCAPGSTKRFLLFLPEGEFHEISLLFAYYIIRSHGHDVLYLGQDLQIKYVKDVYMFYKPDFIFSILTNSLSEEELNKKADTFARTFEGTSVLLAGSGIAQHRINGKQGVSSFYEVSDLLAFMNELSHEFSV